MRPPLTRIELPPIVSLPALYNPRDLALIRRTVASDTTDDEFALFIHWARRLRLDLAPPGPRLRFPQARPENAPPLARHLHRGYSRHHRPRRERARLHMLRFLIANVLLTGCWKKFFP